MHCSCNNHTELRYIIVRCISLHPLLPLPPAVWLKWLCAYLWIKQSVGVPDVVLVTVQSIVGSWWEMHVHVWPARHDKGSHQKAPNENGLHGLFEHKRTQSDRNRAVKWRRHKNWFCEIMGYDETFRKNMMKNFQSQKMSRLLQFAAEIWALLVLAWSNYARYKIF